MLKYRKRQIYITAMPKCENAMKCFSTVRFKPAASANSGYARLDLYHKVSVHASRYYLFIYSVRVYFFPRQRERIQRGRDARARQPYAHDYIQCAEKMKSAMKITTHNPLLIAQPRKVSKCPETKRDKFAGSKRARWKLCQLVEYY